MVSSVMTIPRCGLSERLQPTGQRRTHRLNVKDHNREEAGVQSTRKTGRARRGETTANCELLAYWPQKLTRRLHEGFSNNLHDLLKRLFYRVGCTSV